MEALRLRFGAILEWLLAATCVAAVAALGSVLFREARSVGSVIPVISGETRVEDVPAGVPSRAVSVPMLLLDRGKEVRVGDPRSEVEARLGKDTATGLEAVDQNGRRQRLTRAYDYVGTQFVLVFEQSSPDAEPRVAAIYLK